MRSSRPTKAALEQELAEAKQRHIKYMFAAGEQATTMQQKIYALEQDRDEAHAAIRVMRTALELARSSLIAWNGMGFSGDAAKEMEELYSESPEIKAIDDALDAPVIRRAMGQ